MPWRKYVLHFLILSIRGKVYLVPYASMYLGQVTLYMLKIFSYTKKQRIKTKIPSISNSVEMQNYQGI